MSILMIAFAFLFGGCGVDDSNVIYEPEQPAPEIHTSKAPLYWSVLDYCWLLVV